MAAYSALVSLQQLLNSDEFTLHYPKPLLESLHAKLSLLQSFIEKVFPASKRERSRANKLEAQIRDAVYKAQDFIESSPIFTNETLPSETLQEIIENMDPIIKEAETLAANIRGQDEDKEVETLAGVERIHSVRTTIVGQDEDKEMIVDQLQSDDDKRLVIPITGMPGVGKTTLARSIYEDHQITSQFPYRAWVTVSQDYNVGDIFAKLLTSIESRSRKAGERVYEGSESSLMEKLFQVLYNNKYLLVFDDMWDEEVWYKLQIALPDNENRSRVVVTTRLRGAAESITSSGFIHEVNPLGEEDSWMLLKLRTFGDAPCPDHLEGIGREIARNCKGLPLSITVIGGLLSSERTEEDYWQCIAQDRYAATSDVRTEESFREILSLSYHHLPPELKACFLYMAAFPVDTEISVSKLIKLWVAEGFLTPPQPPQTIERVAENSLTMLIDRNLILIRGNSSDGRIKTCGMHDSLLELAKEEAEKTKFFYSITTSQTEKIEGGAVCQRRVSVHDTILMCRKQVYHSTKSIKYARSLIYVDPHYHYPLPFCLTFDLLRVLDAYTVYHIEFPIEYIKLVHLRYLSLTYNGKLPPSISKLKNLQVLIVRRQPKIIVVGISFLPEEIWDMPQLRHLLFTESELPYPCLEENSLLLENLQTLSNVSATSCTKEVLRNMPNLKKLGMWIDKRGAIGFHLDGLNQLESFKFTVLKPIPTSRIEFQPNLFFPETLRKLSLSGCGLPWEDMEVIAKLPNLEVLKLRELAFQGEEWCPTYVFYKLKVLKIEYLDLQRWESDGSHYPRLDHLILKNCYELEGIPMEIGCLGHLEVIKLVDCSPHAVNAAECIMMEQEAYGNDRLHVRIFSSWE